MKPSWAVQLRWGLGALLSLASACGYRPVEAAGSGGRLCVLAAPSKVPDWGAVQAALDGAREELARYGALALSDESPCLRIEILRVHEVAAGIAAYDVGGSQQPRARGTAVAVVGRGWVESAPGALSSRDTGDVSRTVRQQSSTGALEGDRHDRAIAAAAFQLGHDLARGVLGLPIPSEELP